MNHVGKIVLLSFGMIAAAALSAAAQQMPPTEQPLLVNYGSGAAPRQGDNDHRQVIYLSVPATTTETIYVRIFDPDTNNSTSLFDQIDARASVTRTRFTVFGDEGAFIGNPGDPEVLTEEEMTAGTKLAERVFGRESSVDATWETIAELDPTQGELVDGTRVFRLLVDAISGVNGNVYNVAVSLKPDGNIAPAGLRLFAYTTTVRMPQRGVVTELRFRVPEDASLITLGNFDAAHGAAFYTTQVLSTELAASGQGDWERSTVFAQDRDLGEMAAVTLSGGKEYPNDATFFVATLDGKPIPFELPTRIFDLNERPIPVASVDGAGACMTVKFDGSQSSDPEGAAISYRWLFGDGAESVGPTATHEYTEEGYFTASLEVVDHSPQLGNGATKNVPILVKNPPVALSDKRTLVGAGEETEFDGTPSTARQWKIAHHEWNFGDGTVLEGERVLHAYTEPGTYTVTHQVIDNSGHHCNRAAEQFEVRVNAAPTADAGADRRISVGEEAVLDAGASTDSDGRIVDYQWDFGDGARASGAVVRHAYEAPATYRVKLTVADDSAVANSSDEDSVTVIVNDPPVAEAGTDQSAAIEETLTFNAGQSHDRDGNIIAYDWDFGDGTTATGLEVTHAYAKSGAYTVTLKVTDDSTTDTAITDDTLSVRVNEPPVASTGPDQLVTASLVQFDGSASHDADDEVVHYEWDFGDGNKGEGARPSHVYARPGTYDVTLTVTDASGTIRSSASDRMQVVVNALPIADAGPELVGAPGERLVFQASRSLDPDGQIAEYLWEFRDGATASEKIAEHAFEKPGTYAVRLTVKDDTGHEDAVDHAETLVFINAPPVAMAGADVTVASGDEVRLAATQSFDSDGEIVGYRWDFSDRDEPVDGAEVTRVFDKPGIYSAQLTVTDDSGATNAVATDTVRIAVNHAPVADAGADIVTHQSTITFDGTRSLDADGDPLSYTWDLGDGTKATGPVVVHTYAEGGVYPVILTVDDGTGLVNATSQTAISAAINRPPIAVAGENQQVCTGDTILLDGSRSRDPEGGVLRYTWDFGDGTTSNLVNPTKSYSIGGTYPITLTVRDDSGLANGTNTSQIAAVVDQGPVARAGDDIVACARTEVEFDGSGSTDVDGVVNNFSWDFGDGGVGGGERSKHIFTEPGTYRVFLKIEGEKAGICDSTSTDELEVRIIKGPVAAIKAPAAAPITDTVTFDGSASTISEGKIIDWQWDFGDGETAMGETVTHRYAKPGIYRVSLTLKSDHPSSSCRVVAARHVITVNAPPVADAGADREVALNEEVVFSGAASHDPDGGLTAYEWHFGDGTTATGIEARHRYRQPGSYAPRLTVRDEAGLANSTASDEVKVIVHPAPTPGISGPAVACVGEPLAWQATNPGSHGMSFAWSFGDGATANSSEVTHAYARPGRYSLSVKADDGKGLPSSQQTSVMSVHVNRPPHAAAGPDQMTCPGDTVSFSGSASTDTDGALKAYRWNFGDGTTAEGVDVEHVFARPGTYDVTLTVTDDAGSTCSSTEDSLQVFVNAPPVADAGNNREVWIGGANDALLLDGSSSSDPDGQALSHTWQIGETASAFGERVRHVLTERGDIPVTLTVADSSGLACGTASSTVRIFAKPRD